MNEIKFKHVINSNVTDDIQKIAKTKNMSIVPSDVIIEKMNYRKYRDDSEYHSEVVSITTKALEGEKKLEPGHDHIMLINIDPKMHEKQKISLVLEFENAGKIEVVFIKKEAKKSCCSMQK